MDDKKIRSYVLKKQQQREHARILREQRKQRGPSQNQPSGANNENSSSHGNSMWNNQRHSRQTQERKSRGQYNTPFPVNTRSALNKHDDSGYSMNFDQPKGNKPSKDNYQRVNSYGNQMDDTQNMGGTKGPSGGGFGFGFDQSIDRDRDHDRERGRNNAMGVGDRDRNKTQRNASRGNSGYDDHSFQTQNDFEQSNVEEPSSILYEEDYARNTWTTPMVDNKFRSSSQPAHDLPPAGRGRANNARGGTSAAIPENSSSEIKSLSSMVQQLQGQMHALQFQIDNAKFESKKVREINDNLEMGQKELQDEVQQLKIEVKTLTQKMNSFAVESANSVASGYDSRSTVKPQAQPQPQYKRQRQRHAQHKPRNNEPDDEQSINFDFGNAMKNDATMNDNKYSKRANNFNQCRGNHGRGNQGRANQGRGNYGNRGNRGNRGNHGSHGNQQPRDSSMGAMDVDHNLPKNLRNSDDGMRGGNHTKNNYRNQQSSYESQSHKYSDTRNRDASSYGDEFDSNSHHSQHRQQGGYQSHKSHQSHQPQPSRRNMGNVRDNNINEEDGDQEEVQAPPMSSAADLIAKLDDLPDAYGAPQEQGERVPCGQCGRKFSYTALQKHLKICKKVFGQKRKAFNMKSHRLDQEAQKAANSSKSAQIDEKLAKARKKKAEAWKSQSGMLREAIRAGKIYSQALKDGKSAADIPQIKSQIPDGRVPCPYCNRKFSEDAAERHIPKCKNIKAKPSFLKRRR